LNIEIKEKIENEKRRAEDLIEYENLIIDRKNK